MTREEIAENTTDMLIRVVDDEADVRESLAFMLRKEGFSVAVYPSAHDFLVNDMPSRSGCLLLDVRMDGMVESNFKKKCESARLRFLLCSFQPMARLKWQWKRCKKALSRLLKNPLIEKKCSLRFIAH